jgi:hypothetical protein
MYYSPLAMFAVADVSLDLVIGRNENSKKVVEDFIRGIRMPMGTSILGNFMS